MPEVGEDLARGGDEGREVEGQRVGFDQAQAARTGLRQFGDGDSGARVDFDGDDLLGGAVEQGAGQAAGARPDLDEVAPGEVAGLAGDMGDQVGVEQEVLAQAAAGVQAVAGNDVPKRREGTKGGSNRVKRAGR